MELFRLNSDYLPGDTVKKFDTLAWTERYLKAGDFKLEAVNDLSILRDLPLGCLISHTDTKEVMIVENYELVRNKEKQLVASLTGRTFETFAEKRVTAGSKLALYDGSGNANVEILAAMASCEAARYILRYGLEPGTASTDDEIANLLVVEDIVTYDTDVSYQIQRGDIYNNVVALLQVGDYGVKTVRPNGAQTTLNIVIHDGVNRVATVIFRAQNEDLVDASYFGSIKLEQNYAQIAADTATRLHRTTALGADVYGLGRKVMYEEASDLEGAFSPATSTDALAGRGQAALDKNRVITLMQAQVSETAKPKFKYDYDVGDIVMVYGEFSVASAMRVTEHILTIDENGMNGYPSLSIV